MKKRIAVMLLASLLLTGCTKTTSYTYKVDNGANVEVQLVTEDDYSLKVNGGHYLISNKGTTVLEGLFLNLDAYKSLMSQLDNQGVQPVTINRNYWYFFTDTDTGMYAAIALLDDAQTPTYVTSNLSKSDMEDILGMVTLTTK